MDLLSKLQYRIKSIIASVEMRLLKWLKRSSKCLNYHLDTISSSLLLDDFQLLLNSWSHCT